MNDSSKIGIIKIPSLRFFRDFFSHENTKLFNVPSYLYSAYNYLKISINTDTHKFHLTTEAIVTQFGFYLTTYVIFSCCTYLFHILILDRITKSVYFNSLAKRILVVTAHPNDECMFFGPLIVRMVKKEKHVYLLCLSNREADGKGFLRKRELWSSCRVLGMKPENVFLCNSSVREDTNLRWKSEIVGLLIRDYVEVLDIDTLVTFDKYGVTGDYNHISTFKAVSYLNVRKLLPKNCHIFLLDSLGYFRQYSSSMDVGLGTLLSENIFILPPSEHQLVRKALRMHKTQLNWYRRFYIMFSRYTEINTFSELPRYIELIGRRHLSSV